MEQGNAYPASHRLRVGVRNQDIARIDSPTTQFLPDDADGIDSRTAQIEDFRQIDDGFNVVLCRALEARCVVALICPHDKNITGTWGAELED